MSRPRLADPVDIPAWDHTALCTQIGVEMFFPAKGVSSAQAKAVCRRCPFLNPCATYALHNDVAGVWGGTSELDRLKARKQLGIIPRLGYDNPANGALGNQNWRGRLDGDDAA